MAAGFGSGGFFGEGGMRNGKRFGWVAAGLLSAAAITAITVPLTSTTGRVALHIPRLKIISTVPADRATGVAGQGPISVVFNHPVAHSGAVPTINPPLAGHWQRSGRTLTFLPEGAYSPDSTVTVSVPGRELGVRGADGAMLKSKATTFSFKVGDGSVLRAEQILARLGYLPLQFTPVGAWGLSPAAYSSAVFDPSSGSFIWRFTPPASLRALWQPGADDTLFSGAMMAFESRHQLPTDGQLSAPVWNALLGAGRSLSANYLRSGYVYAVASQSLPETLNVYDNGRVVLHSLANTGIQLSPTLNGNYPVYLRYATQTMSGVDPWGRHYSDPVSWVAYFDGSQAVHYFDRASYGFNQSLGCVELPFQQARTAWSYLQIGAIVSVEG